ncbi:MAG TPA: NrfD/PsrC family molybdoenzyme membrane anchor subunit [Gemmatimonadota bacterium]|nr:NrfD/PsrC family molybdoenzyme membrane anchor subunit [Gemmatimonadota bacterium]
MTGRPQRPVDRATEERLDALREEAGRTGAVAAAGAPVAGGPIPQGHGYYGRPVVKPPVWTWEIPLYFFVGGAAGMAAAIALGATITGPDAVLEGGGPRAGMVRAALWLAAAGAALSPILLILDLGRPARFLNMLRVFKWRSAMSIGAWTLVAFGATAATAALLVEILHRAASGGDPGGGPLGLPVSLIEMFALGLIAGAGVAGALLATYTGVLLGATTIPAWFTHHRLLPIHFGAAGLGSAAAALELLGFELVPLHALGLAAAGIETAVWAGLELRSHGAADRALREGRAGLLLRASGLLAGPLALVLRLVGWVPAAAAVFLAGALIGRYGWLAAGRASGRDPEATFATQRSTRGRIQDRGWSLPRPPG